MNFAFEVTGSPSLSMIRSPSSIIGSSPGSPGWRNRYEPALESSNSSAASIAAGDHDHHARRKSENILEGFTARQGRRNHGHFPFFLIGDLERALGMSQVLDVGIHRFLASVLPLQPKGERLTQPADSPATAPPASSALPCWGGPLRFSVRQSRCKYHHTGAELQAAGESSWSPHSLPGNSPV